MDFIRRLLAVFVGVHVPFFVLGAVGVLFTDEDSTAAKVLSALLLLAIGYGLYRLTKKIWPSKQPESAPIETQTNINTSQTEGKGLDQRAIDELSRLAELILADDEVSQKEAETLREWFVSTPSAMEDDLTSTLYDTVEFALEDGLLDAEEADEIKTLLSEFCDDQGLTDPHDFPVHTEIDSSVPVTPSTALLSGDELYISYVDAKGDASDRLVKVRGVSYKNERLYLNAICLSKHKYRSFRADRITDMTRTDTGEFITDPFDYVLEAL